MNNRDNKSMGSSLSFLVGRRHALAIGSFIGAGLCLILFTSANHFHFLPRTYIYNASCPLNWTQSLSASDDLDIVLRNASMIDKTVIITTMNGAWAEPNSLMDIFLESFRIGNQTRRLLNHLVIVAFDQKAYARCLAKHSHCHALKSDGVDFSATEAYYMTPKYFEMMWRRHKLLTLVLEKGYNFVFTDADIVWFGNPFPHFYSNADFQTACDKYRGNPSDLNNRPNNGFTYVKSNCRTIAFYKFWYSSRKTYPGLNEQDVLNKIKYNPYIKELGLQIRFLDTVFFSGFCQPSTKIDQVCTVHANCCFGLQNKMHDLRIILEDWKKHTSSSQRGTAFSWSAPQKCSFREFHPPKKE